MCYLSQRISRRYDALSRYSSVAKKPKHPRRGSIYIHGKLLVHGATIKWVYGRPCWNHPAFATKPGLIDNLDGTFTLPSNPS